MIRKLGILAAVVVTLAITASLAMAAITFHSGPNVSFSGSTATATFNISGLGNVPASGQLVLQGYSSYTCTNKGGNEAPGQNPAVDFTAGGSAVGVVDKNGRASIDATTTLPSVSARDAGCPNGKWTVTVGDVIFNSYSFTITQGQQTLFTCTGSFPGGSEDNDSSTPSCT